MDKSQHDSFCIYRMPFDNETKIIKGNCQNFMVNLNNLSGNHFVISPFNHGQKAFIIPFLKEEEFLGNEILNFNYLPLQEPTAKSEKKYQDMVTRAINQMLDGKMQKVVLANKKEVLTKNFSPIDYFKKIEVAYKNAFVYLLSSPHTGVWIGATPEPLLTTNEINHKTIALAGTIVNGADQTFGEKEWHEQNLVEIYIEKKLKDNQIDFTKQGPFPYESAKLIHLKTEYTFPIELNSQRIFSLIEELNPTPATAGLPKQFAIEFIKKNEEFNRSLYTGFLGIMKDSNTNLFVNLRCMQVDKNQITLFAGAGITKNSIASDEWVETQNKMKTLENHL